MSGPNTLVGSGNDRRIVPHGTWQGALIAISRDAVQDEQLGPVYQARVQVQAPTEGVARGMVFW